MDFLNITPDVERTVRNQMVENQMVDPSWLKSDPSRQDTNQFTWRDVGERMVGGGETARIALEPNPELAVGRP